MRLFSPDSLAYKLKQQLSDPRFSLASSQLLVYYSYKLMDLGLP